MGDGYVAIENGEAFLYNVNIAQYSFGNRFNHQAKQKRRLLLHKREILKLHQQVREKGLTIVKVEIAVCRGKSFADKRETLREREDKLEAKRLMARRG